MRKRALVAAFLVAGIASMALWYAHSGDSGPSFVLETERFAPLPLAGHFPFDLVVADMNLDGATDLLVNWHHLGRMELFENRDGRFALLNPKGADASGLLHNHGIPDLFAFPETMVAEIDAAGEPGVYLWHDLDRNGAWNFYVVTDTPVQLHLRTNTPIQSVNLQPARVKARDRFNLRTEIDASVHFRLEVDLVATRLEVRTAAPVHVGADRRRVRGMPVVVWKDDPHGIAWVDAVGTPNPDLYVSRGGLKGTLKPPHPPKTDRFFRHDTSTHPYDRVETAIPEDYGRGRKVAWVDIDADGSNELYVGNTETRNVLLRRDDDAHYRDIAPVKGLNFMLGDTFAWMDLNADGFDELITVDAQGFRVAWNRAGEFTVVPGETVGLELVEPPIPARRLFNGLSLSVVDLDNDGHLDLWMSGHGDALQHAVYRFDGSNFEDVTQRMGLAKTGGVHCVVLLDIDNDSYVDAVTLGTQSLLLHNRKGKSFDVRPLDLGWHIPQFARAVAADVDRDGRRDLIVVARQRAVARNTTAHTLPPLEVRLADPRHSIGAVVRVRYVDGTTRAQRYGSADSTQYSQGLLPLVFGTPPGAGVESLEVRWPGGGVKKLAVDKGTRTLELSR